MGYNDQIAASLPQYPQNLAQVSPTLINTNVFNQLQKAKLLAALQQSYLAQGKPLNTVQQFNLGSAQQLAQAGLADDDK